MRKTYLTRSILVATLISTQSFAAGFQINAQSATGLGRAFAGDAVIADNASVMARNPAAMALFDSTSMSLGIEQVTSFIEVTDVTYVLGQNPEDTDDVGGTSYVPNFHLIVPVNDQFAWGVNAYSNFGTETDFPTDYSAPLFAGNTKIASYNLGVAGSYRINEQWSVGAGLDFIYGQGTFQRGGLVATGSETSYMNIDGADGWGLGFNLGTVYELDENNRFGLAYHYSPDFTAEDDYGQEVSFSLPDMLEFSGYHKLEDSKWAVHYSIEYISWGEFDTVEFSNLSQGSIADDPSPTNPLGQGSSYSSKYDWQDGWHYAIGTTYYLNSDWTLRAGYMYDTSAQDEKTSISVPDSDRHWFSFGTTYHINTQSNVDFGFTYLMSEDVDVVEGEGTLTGTTRADAILIGLQYSRTF
ncbi:outer membrane protein transport protein [Vibrio sp. SG41-7]|uniref:outer membrane protein transport protein n=1 Tax=Vibrio sp. SG41-7 TaxID=2760973 RepID=UPI0016035C59|nr:outer membrane protein transport protein [Vibrio sp. SG41-7]MBB1464585.1 outer membrane protein transport protein [Vibrio sp. SG41-7]